MDGSCEFSLHYHEMKISSNAFLPMRKFLFAFREEKKTKLNVYTCLYILFSIFSTLVSENIKERRKKMR